MIVNIEKVIVKDRIRKDFGNIKELADDIKQNGLINPPVVNKEYELLAGERRLRACKSLGWNQIEVRMMDTRDAEHELNVEISENESRKEFSKSERVDYMRRLLRIEQAKAKERQTLGEKSHEGGRADEKTAEKFDMSSNTLRKELSIADNRDMLTPEDFADWDEGRLSTNKAFQKIKAALKEKEKELAELEKNSGLPSHKEEFYQNRINTITEASEKLKAQVVELEAENRELQQTIDDMEDAGADFRYEQLEQALRELEAFRHKYSGFAELEGVFDEIDKVIEAET